MGFKSKWLFAGLCLPLLAASGCSKDEHTHEAHYDGPTMRVREQGADFLIPSMAWDLLLTSPADKAKAAEKAKGSGGGEHGGGHGGGGEGGAGEDAAMTTSSFVYAPVTVILKEKNPGVLKEREIHFEMPEGGSEIDLAKWVTGQPGTFHVRFEYEGQQAEKIEDAKILFYSRAKKRRVGDDIVGAGCQKVLELTKYLGAQGEAGLTLNTTRNFHTTVIGGHFLFSWMKEGMRKVSRVTFLDSSNPTLFCESEK